MPKREKTRYPGVSFIEGEAIGTGKPERIYYIRYRKDGKAIEEKAGRAFQDDMTPSRAATIRSQRIAGNQISNQAKRDAEKAAKEANEGRLTIGKLWDQYCETNPDNKILKHEQRKFDVHIRGAIGDKEPSELMPIDVDRIRLRLQKKGFRTTSARILELIRRTINYGVKKGLIPPIGFKIEIPRLNNIKTEDLSSDQLAKLITALDVDEDQAAADVLRLALFSGMRRGEIFKLQRGDLDFERRFILLRDPKSGRDEKIPMNETVLAIFKKILDRHNEAFLFPGKFKDTHITACPREFIKRIKTAAVLPENFRPMHGLRHVYASMLASSGKVDLYTLQKLLTHKSPSMTIRYAHLQDGAMRRAADVAGDFFNGIANGNNQDQVVKIEKM